jgi:hypothetical protein
LNEFLRSVDPERLRTVTRDLSALIQSIAVASEEFGKTLAKDAFGFLLRLLSSAVRALLP